MFSKLLGWLLVLATVPAVASAATDPPPIFVGGQFIREHAVADIRGHLLVPVRGVFEAFGASVVYTPPRIVVVRKGEAVVAGLVIGRRFAVVANRRRNLDVAPIRLGGHVYVPLRSVAEIAGASVQYSQRPRLVDIRVPNNELAVSLAVPHVSEPPPDPTLPPWAYALVGVSVLGFALEIVRQLARHTPRRRFARPTPLAASALSSTNRPLQLPYPPGARDQHRIGKIAK